MQLKGITLEGLQAALQRKVWVSTHGEDADGICSALLLEKAGVPVEEVHFAQEFGEYLPSTTLMLDMVPLGGYNKLLIDHHSDSLASDATVAFGEHCTTLSVLELLKDRISPKDYWIAIAGAVGDARELCIPTYVWMHKPTRETMLLQTSKVGYGGKEYQTPVWKELPWCINGMAKANKAMQVYTILKNATSPLDVILDDVIEDARATLRKEEEQVRKSYPSIDLREVTILPYTSQYKIGGRMTSSIVGSRGRTVLAVDISNKRFSLRGLLANYVADVMEEKGFGKVGGHEGFRAGHLNGTIERLIEVLREEGL